MKKALLALSISIVLAGLVSCGGHEAPEQKTLPALAVRTAKVVSAEIPDFQEVVGTVRPGHASQVSAKATGRIVRFLAAPGMRVKAGDPLVELEVNQLKASLERVEATLEQANHDLKRYQNLLSSGAATQAEFDRIQAQQRVAAATVKETESMIANATVTAPFSGVITRKFADTGDLAVPGKLLFSLEDATLLRLEIDVAESLAGTVQPDQKLKVHIAAVGAELEGVVSEIAPAAEAASRTFLIKLDLPSHANLRAGQFGRAFIPRGVRNVLIVPSDCVFSRGQMDYVFVAKSDQTANLRIVRTGSRSENGIEILAGVEGDEPVILSPPAELRDRQPIEIAAK